MRTPFTGCGYGAGDSVHVVGGGRRAGGAPAGPAADRGGRALPRAVRHDRRGADADAATSDRRVVEIVVEEVRGRVPVLAGAGGNDTREVVEAPARDARGGRRRPPRR